MFTFSDSIYIKAPRWQVSEFCANHANLPAWYGAIRSAELAPAGLLIAGSQLRVQAGLLGVRFPFTCAVRQYLPGYNLVLEAINNPFTLVTEMEWEEGADGRTLMTLRTSGGFPALPRPLAFVADLLMRVALDRATIRNLARLRRLLERTAGSLGM